MRKFFEANREMWDEFARINYDSKTYKTQEFIDGATSLKSIELEELGDVKGKTLLHLQCHFGLDTLSWAREGAVVTGVDFSEDAVILARKLAELTNIDARFIESNVYDLPDILNEQFDIVFTSYGVLCWLNDIPRWAEIVSHFLKPGGIFYIAEFHPLTWTFDWDATDDFKIVRTYFSGDEPHKFLVEGSYADTKELEKPRYDYEWPHSMGEVITSITQAGLSIEFFHEFPKMPFQLFSFLKQHEDRYWYYENETVQLPLSYSIKARKR